MIKKKFNLILIIFIFSFIFLGLFLGLKKESYYVPKNFNTKKVINLKSKEFFSRKEIKLYDILKNDNLTIINIWASWCLPCREEHKYILALSKESNINLVGLNYKDKSSNAKKFIKKYGDPYDIILADTDGTNSIELGAYGVPETFVIENKKKKYLKSILDHLIKLVLMK